MTRESSSYTRSLLGMEGLGASELTAYLDAAQRYRQAGDWQSSMSNNAVALMFMEPSTRTRFSFEMACHRLGAAPLVMSAEGSSMSKGETLLDSARSLREVGASVLVLRHGEENAPHKLAETLGIPVINAGDGTHEHPTQALLDLLTMRDAHGSMDGRTVAIVGDVAHSRVARSNVLALKTMGAHVVVVGPEELCPEEISAWGVQVERNLDTVVGQVDVMMMLRIQRERIAGCEVPSVDVYRRQYGLTAERAERLGAGCVVLHPAPMNRGVEIDGTVADGSKSRVFDQMRNGVFIRMACLMKAATGRP